MQLVQAALAGTLESSDAQVMVENTGIGIELSIESDVINQYGRQIRETVLETLGRLGIENARVKVIDKGALDCTLRARVECAVFRACRVEKDYPWGGVIK
ncbi:MAG: citrate lyase acyl carrier protein [Eubacteriales bacterium]|jgi:citrate lyase subunit gamma (acyl carrier protein)|nr:citrate lyase acyl carrier protein [Eubacteriales bacterium]MDD3571399.1 citrate lyase acyl carrier protein [Eubacteriales bacterium]MDD4135039.1 citrate lyase acyl carrier protein [Eubacteriales bacterium]